MTKTENEKPKSTSPAEIRTAVDEIGRYGAAVFQVTAEEFYRAGYASGDIITVTVGGREYTAPAGTAYSDVDNGELIFLKIEFENRMLLAVSNENGFALKQGIRPGDEARIRMKEPGGYLKQYELRKLSMGTDRREYADDETFCNFRAVRAGKLKENCLYRGFSPVNPMENRAYLTDRLLAATPVKTVINLDGEGVAECRKFAGFEKSHYATRNIVPLKVSFSAEDPTFPENMKKLVRILLEEEEPFYIHCRYGRDRTGLLCMVIEALCEASFEELMDDYMLSYENIHGLVKNSEKWKLQLEKKAYRAFEELTGISPEGQEKLQQISHESVFEKERSMAPDRDQEERKKIRLLMENRLLSCGVSREELTELEKKLCGR